MFSLSFARGEEEVKPFDEELYGKSATVTRRSLEDLMSEAILVRNSTLALYRSFTNEMLESMGKSFSRSIQCTCYWLYISGSPAMAL